MLDGVWQLFNLRLTTNWRLDFGGDAEYNARARRASLLPFDTNEEDSDSLSESPACLKNRDMMVVCKGGEGDV